MDTLTDSAAGADLSPPTSTNMRSAWRPCRAVSGTVARMPFRPARRARFFVPDGASFVVAKEVREHVHLFAAQRGARSALLADRPDFLPQSADLFRRCNSRIRWCRCSITRCGPRVTCSSVRPKTFRTSTTCLHPRRQALPAVPQPRPMRRSSARLPLIINAMRAVQGGKTGAPEPRRRARLRCDRLAEGYVLERYAPRRISW